MYKKLSGLYDKLEMSVAKGCSLAFLKIVYEVLFVLSFTFIIYGLLTYVNFENLSMTAFQAANVILDTVSTGIFVLVFAGFFNAAYKLKEKLMVADNAGKAEWQLNQKY